MWLQSWKLSGVLGHGLGVEDPTGTRDGRTQATPEVLLTIYDKISSDGKIAVRQRPSRK